MREFFKYFSIKPFLAISGIIFTPLQNTYGQQNWHEMLSQIKLFRSTRVDVERLFKYSKLKETADSDGSQTVYYYMEGGKLHIDYSTGRCIERNSSHGYNAERSVVTGFYVAFSDFLPQSEFSFKWKSFEKVYVSRAVIYSNENLGIKIEGGETTISSIEFSPSKAQETKYNCTNLR